MMIQADLSSYFSPQNEWQSNVALAQLKLDLTDKIEKVYSQIQNSPMSLPEVKIQSTTNALRRSIEQISHFKNEGQCRGSCDWFIALLLNFKKKYPDISTYQLLKEIAKEFANGVGVQGACLQRIYEEGQEHFIQTSLNFELKHHEWDLESKDITSEKILKRIYELEEGLYLLSFSGYKAEKKEEDIPGHATVIVIEKGNYYFFDINEGLAGTGIDIGSTDKVKDLAYLWAMCNKYSPLDHATHLFEKGLQGLSTLFSKEEVEAIQRVVRRIDRKGRACLSAFEVFAISDGFKISSEEQRDKLLLDLCIRPGLMQVKLEFTNLHLKKCILRDSA